MAQPYTLPSLVGCSVMSVTHGWFGPARVKSRSTRSVAMSSARSLPLAPTVEALQAGSAHQQLDLVVADRHTAAQGQFGVDASRAVDLVGLDVDLADQVGEHAAPEGALVRCS
jgi:hypothetical protein